MTWKTRIDTELDRLASLGGVGRGTTQRLSLDIDGDRLQCELAAIDQLACAFEQFVYKTDKLSGASVDQLQSVAERLSNRLSYLLEPISPIEVNLEKCLVQMRSKPPHRDEEGSNYYELVVRRGEMSLCRYQKMPGRERRVIPANVTREVFCRLVTDFAAAP